MIRQELKDVACAELMARCDAARDAYAKASRALDAGLRRTSGATAIEWKAEYDARIELRLAREAYAAASRDFTASAAAQHRLSRIALDS
jgi:hypothetical protein